MSYIDDIQKINKLAKEMMDHGMAASLDEAVAKAQQTLMKSGSIQLDLGEMNTNLAREQQKRAEVVGEVTVDPASGQATFQNKTNDGSGMTWQDAMTKNTKFVVAQFKDMQNAIGVLMAEIQQLKRDAQASRRGQTNVQQISVPSGSEQVINIDDAPAAQNKPKSGADEYSKDHPKQGNFTSDDVSITKVFDFSHK